MNQLDISFDRVTFARAHTNDPASSHRAAAEGERSGSFKRKAERVLSWNKKRPNSTARELCVYANEQDLDLMTFRKRLGELAKCGLVDAVLTKDTKPCEFAGTRDTRYSPR